VFYASRDGYAPGNTGEPGYYCGSYRDVGYGTLENGRKAANFYGSATYRLNDSASLFLDIQAGYSHQISYNTPLQWENSYKLNGDSTPIPFFNQATGQSRAVAAPLFHHRRERRLRAGGDPQHRQHLVVEYGRQGRIWRHRLALRGAVRAFAKPVGEQGAGADLGEGAGAVLGSLARRRSGQRLQHLQCAHQPFVHPVDRGAVPFHHPGLDRQRQKPRGEFHADGEQQQAVRSAGGPVGFAGVAEYGTQYFGLVPDPLSLDGSYFGLHNTGAVGSRDHFGFASEFRAPIFSKLTANVAGRYDSYKYSGTTTGKFTYNAGLEYRPFNSLLLRGSVGTGFRAPDLAYLYAGLSGSSSGGTDYYLCRRDEPSSAPDYVDNCSNGDVASTAGATAARRSRMRPAPHSPMDWCSRRSSPCRSPVDYYLIKLENEVEYQDSDTILREEADCRLGQTIGGAPVNGNSALCQQVLSQVVRNSPTDPSNPSGITSVLVLPINAAVDRTSGIDFNAHYLISTDRIGSFDFNSGFTDVLTHTIQLFPGDPVDNELTDWYYYVIPRNKASYSAAWSIGDFTTTVHGSRIGGLPNYDGTDRRRRHLGV
jgi:iron complex outermembrane receptor protein